MEMEMGALTHFTMQMLSLPVCIEACLLLLWDLLHKVRKSGLHFYKMVVLLKENQELQWMATLPPKAEPLAPIADLTCGDIPIQITIQNNLAQIADSGIMSSTNRSY